MTADAASGSGRGSPRSVAATVVIPTYNSAATLPRALASIEGSEDEVEILIVDDASGDSAALEQIAAGDGRITLIRKPERTNAAHSRALGLERAAGDIVLFLDSDDWFLPGHVARRRAIHADGAGVVVGRFRLSDGARKWDGPMAPYAGGDFEDYLFAGGGDARSSTISVGKQAWRGTTFDPALTKHQDWGFLLDCWRGGERIGFDPAAGVTISIDGTSRMSRRSDAAASLAFARDRLHGEVNRRRFLLGRLRTSIRLGDMAAAAAFRDALLRLSPPPRERWGSAAMVLAGRTGIARPVHRLLTALR